MAASLEVSAIEMPAQTFTDTDTEWMKGEAPMPAALDEIPDWFITLSSTVPETRIALLDDNQRRKVYDTLVAVVITGEPSAANSEGQYSHDEVVARLLARPDAMAQCAAIYPGLPDHWLLQQTSVFANRIVQLRNRVGIKGLQLGLADALTSPPSLPDLPDKPLLSVVPPTSTKHSRTNHTPGNSTKPTPDHIAAARATRREQLRAQTPRPFDLKGVDVAREVLRILGNDPTTKYELPNALCRQVDPEDFFVPGAAQNKVKDEICSHCLHRNFCAAYALSFAIESGVWGTTERERRAFLREHPDLKDWAKQVIADADTEAKAEKSTAAVTSTPEVTDSSASDAITAQYTTRNFRA